MADLDKIVEELGSLTLLEAADLVKQLEETWGVSAAAPMAMAGMPVMAAGDGGAAAEEKTEFDVRLTDFGAKKIQVIKEVRALTGLGLKEAKDAVEAVPTVVMEAVGKEAAEEAAKKLTDAGGTAEVV